MVIVFFSNYLNPHQKFLSEEIQLHNDVDFYFVSTIQVHVWRVELGYPEYLDLPYVIHSWKDKIEENKARELALNADVAIFGAI